MSAKSPSAKSPRSVAPKRDAEAREGDKKTALEQVHSVLKATALEKLINEKQERLHSRPVILEHNMTIGDALKTLAKHHILSAPMVIYPTLQGDSDELGGAGLAVDSDAMSRPTYLGIIDVHDMMLALLAEIKDSSSVRSPAEWTAELKKIEDTFLNRMLITVIGHGDGELLFNARLGTSLFETVRAGFLTGAANRKSVGGNRPHVNHRIAIFDDHGTVVEIVSQSDVLRFLKDHQDVMGTLGSFSVEELALCPAGDDVESVAESVPTIQALAMMRDKSVSALAVVDEAGTLVGNLSVADLRGITPPHLDVLALPVGDFLRETHGVQPKGATKKPIHIFFDDDAAEQRRHKRRRAADSAASGDAGSELPLVVCHRSTPLATVVRRIVSNNVHRLYVVSEEDKKPLGVVTATDVMRVLVGNNGGAAAAAEGAAAAAPGSAGKSKAAKKH